MFNHFFNSMFVSCLVFILVISNASFGNEKEDFNNNYFEVGFGYFFKEDKMSNSNYHKMAFYDYENDRLDWHLFGFDTEMNFNLGKKNSLLQNTYLLFGSSFIWGGAYPEQCIVQNDSLLYEFEYQAYFSDLRVGLKYCVPIPYVSPFFQFAFSYYFNTINETIERSSPPNQSVTINELGSNGPSVIFGYGLIFNINRFIIYAKSLHKQQILNKKNSSNLGMHIHGGVGYRF